MPADQSSPPRQVTVEQALNAAVGHHRAGRLAEAEEIYHQVLDEQPHNPVALHLLGMIAHQVGQFDIAEDLICQAVTFKPDFAEAHSNLGLVRQALGRTEDAIADYQTAISINPGFPEALGNLASALQDLGQFAEAVDCYEKLLALEPANVEAMGNLGVILHQMERLHESVDYFYRALEISPELAALHFALGNALKLLGRLDEAVDCYRRAISHEAVFPQANNGLAGALEIMGRLDDAVAVLTDALAIEPSDVRAETHGILGGVLIKLGRIDEAITELKAAVHLDPNYRDAHEALKKIYWDSEQRDSMDQSYFETCTAHPQSARCYCNLGAALIVSERPEEAREALETALRLDPVNGDAHNHLGRVYRELGRSGDAVTEHESAIEADGGNAIYYEEFARSLAASGDFEGALEKALQANELDNRRADILALVTISMHETGDSRIGDIVDYEKFVTTRLIDVPDGFSDLAEFNEALHAELAARHDDGPPPLGQTLRGGTQITEDLFAYPDGMVKLARDRIAAAIETYVGELEEDPGHPFLRNVPRNFRFTGAWSNIIYGQGRDISHVHNEGWLSGVYYILTPDLAEENWDKGEGCIQFGEPPPPFVSEKNRIRRSVRPEPGMAVFFPSYYWHGVRPFSEQGLRHTIAFDLI